MLGMKEIFARLKPEEPLLRVCARILSLCVHVCVWWLSASSPDPAPRVLTVVERLASGQELSVITASVALIAADRLLKYHWGISAAGGDGGDI